MIEDIGFISNQRNVLRDNTEGKVFALCKKLPTKKTQSRFYDTVGYRYSTYPHHIVEICMYL